MRDIRLDCDVLFAVKKDETQYKLSDFLFENLEITARKSGTIQKGYIHGLQLRNVVVNGVRLNRKKLAEQFSASFLKLC